VILNQVYPSGNVRRQKDFDRKWCIFPKTKPCLDQQGTKFHGVPNVLIIEQIMVHLSFMVYLLGCYRTDLDVNLSYA